MKKLPKSLIVVISSALIVSFSSITASANPVRASSAQDSTTNISMTVVRYDAALAESHGYEIRTRLDGSQYSVLKGRASVTPRVTGIKPGDCGYSFVTLSDGSRLMASGFVVYAPVAWRKWGVTVKSSRMTQNFSMDGGPTEARYTEPRPIPWATGLTRATVNAGSYAALWDGAICYAASPSIAKVY
jgi:hypothetical protein